MNELACSICGDEDVCDFYRCTTCDRIVCEDCMEDVNQSYYCNDCMTNGGSCREGGE